jgi:myosin heavy subunit
METVKGAVRRASQAAQSVAALPSSLISTIIDHRRDDKSGAENDEDFIAMHAKDRVNLTLRSTPTKDAPTVNALSTKAGVLLKRNEQGLWQKRYVCIVPHMFLYYFDNENSESPRGVIDLHLFTNLSIEGSDGNILKLAPPPEANNLKSYYFQSDDPNILSAWITCLHRDRYQVIRDERDAYQQLQDQFSGEMDSATKNIELSALDKERMQIEVAEAKRESEKALQTLQTLLLNMGVSKDEVNNYTCPSLAAHAVSKYSNELKEKLERKVHQMLEKTSTDKKENDQKIENYENQIENEKAEKKRIEVALLQENDSVSKQLREAQHEVDKANLNLQLVMTEKSNLENKLSTISEQKKILIKEVKLLRSKVEQLSKVKAETKSDEVYSQLRDNCPSVDIEYPETVTFSSNDNLNKEASAGGNSSSVYTDDAAKIETHTKTTHDDEKDWEIPAAVALQSIPWLSPEQRSLVEDRVKSIPQHDINAAASAPSVSGERRTSFSMMGSLFSQSYTTNGTSSTSTVVHNESTASSSELNTFFDSPLASGVESEASVQVKSVLKCLRCDGTVEGPKYSTCKCKIPALTPEELESSSNSKRNSIFNIIFNK